MDTIRLSKSMVRQNSFPFLNSSDAIVIVGDRNLTVEKVISVVCYTELIFSMYLHRELVSMPFCLRRTDVKLRV